MESGPTTSEQTSTAVIQQESVREASAPMMSQPSPPRSTPENCATCGQQSVLASMGHSHVREGDLVYVVGQLSPEFPSTGVEKEFAQAAGIALTSGLIDAETLRELSRNPENRYLGRHLCWVFTVGQIEVFTVRPRDREDVTTLLESISTDTDVLHVVVGHTVRATGDSPCASAGLPEVYFEQLLAFTLDEFVDALPAPDADEARAEAVSEQLSSGNASSEASSSDQNQLRLVAKDVFLRLTHRRDNRGMADEHRALNYCALRYPQIYFACAQARREGNVLLGVDAIRSQSHTRTLVTVRLTFRHRQTDISERYQCVVDVTEVFPFLATRLQRTYD